MYVYDFILKTENKLKKSKQLHYKRFYDDLIMYVYDFAHILFN